MMQLHQIRTALLYMQAKNDSRPFGSFDQHFLSISAQKSMVDCHLFIYLLITTPFNSPMPTQISPYCA